VSTFSLSLFVCLLSFQAFATGFVALGWNASVDPNVVGYKIYYGLASGVYTWSIDVGNVTNAVVSGLTQNTSYYFAAKSCDALGNESDFSGEANITASSPAAMTFSSGTYAGGQFNLCVSGSTNYQCVVQVSTNLTDWVAVQTNTIPFTFVDSNASQFNQCFYRTVNLQ